MTQTVTLMTENDVQQIEIDQDEQSFGALRTPRGVLPLKAMDVAASLDGLFAETTIQQTFVNAFNEPLEASYIFPLPDRAAVTQFRLEVADRIVEGVLKERGQARQEFAEAIQTGHRAAIAEEERPGVFTMRVGNIPPGEEARVTLKLVGSLAYADGEATYRFPLVVAPRYIPGVALSGPQVGLGVGPDTDAVPDASRITPPVLLPGFANPVQLTLCVTVQPSRLPIEGFRSSLHALLNDEQDGTRRLRIKPGERLNRDFILRFRVAGQHVATSLRLQPDEDGGVFALTMAPPATAHLAFKPREVIFILDRSGSMSGWKIVAARRAVGRMVDTLTDRDRFTVYAFDDQIETPVEFVGPGLVQASNRNRFRALEFLAKIDARGGTEMAQPLDRAVSQLQGNDPERDRILVLITDGQVGNEDQILKNLGPRLGNMRIFTLGIDMAVNEGFLNRLASLGGGCCDLVESEDRLDEVMDKIHRRIAAPVLTGLSLKPSGLTIDQDTLVPSRTPDLFAGAPLVIMGRYQGNAPQGITLQAKDAAGKPWTTQITAATSDQGVLGAVWARGHLRDLEDRYVVNPSEALCERMVAVSLKHGVLCRFTAFLAVDRGAIVNAGGKQRQILQPVDMPEGWEMFKDAPREKRCLSAGITTACFAMPQNLDDSAMESESLPSLGELKNHFVDASLEESDQEDDARSLGLNPPQPILARKPGVLDKIKKILNRFSTGQDQESGRPSPLDLFAYRQRARDLLDSLRLGTRADVLRRRQTLDKLILELNALIGDLKSVGIAEGEFAALVELAQALTQPVASEVEFEEIWRDAENVLDAFAQGRSPADQRRASFWK